MKNIILKKLIEKLIQAKEFPHTAKGNINYVIEELSYEMGVNSHMAQHISNIKKING